VIVGSQRVNRVEHCVTRVNHGELRDRSPAACLRDEAELFGLLGRLQALGAALVSVSIDP
jgi:hypothetical protein